LAAKGQRAISAVSPGAVEYIQEHGFPGTVMTFRNFSGRILGRLFCGRKEWYSFDMLMMPIGAVVCESLLQDMPPGVIEWGGSNPYEMDEGVMADRNSERVDFVIGGDGVRSVVREAILGTSIPQNTSKQVFRKFEEKFFS